MYEIESSREIGNFYIITGGMGRCWNRNKNTVVPWICDPGYLELIAGQFREEYPWHVRAGPRRLDQFPRHFSSAEDALLVAFCGVLRLSMSIPFDCLG
jgi:hypothetical protein